MADRLRDWRFREPCLAGVREPEALAALPEAERLDWLAFWDDLDALIDRALGVP